MRGRIVPAGTKFIGVLLSAIFVFVQSIALGQAEKKTVPEKETASEENCSIPSVFEYPLRCRLDVPEEGKVKGGVLLIHMLGRHMDDYRTFARFLKSRNYCVLSFNLPGHPPPSEEEENAPDWRSFGTPQYAKMVFDVKSALQEMKKQCNVETARAYMVGAELGATLALWVTVRYGGVSKVVLLSPPLVIKRLDVQALLKTYTVPQGVKFLIITDTGHTYFYFSALKLQTFLGETAKMYTISRNLLGTFMLRGDLGVEEKILSFLED